LDFFFKDLFIYERERAGGGGRRRGRVKLKQSVLSMELDAGLHLTTL